MVQNANDNAKAAAWRHGLTRIDENDLTATDKILRPDMEIDAWNKPTEADQNENIGKLIA